LFDVIHPRTMHWREVHHKSRMPGQPSGDIFAMMRTDMVTDQMNRPDVRGNLLVQVFQEGEAFLLPFAFITLSIDPSGTGIEGRKEVERASACLLVLIPVGKVLRRRWSGQGPSRARLQGGLLVQREHQLILTQRASIEVDECSDGRIEGRVPRWLRIEPALMAPGLELVGEQKTPDGGGGDDVNNPLRDELPRQFGTIPWREATAAPIGAFAGQADRVDGDRRGKNRPWRRGRGRP
jgi:hypothetical protein